MIGTVVLFAALAQTPAELATPWDAREMIQQLRGKVTRLSGALNQLQVTTWQGAGAENYVAVTDSARRNVAAIGGALDRLALEPQRLSHAIHVFMTLQQVTTTLDTLTKGVAQFQGADSAREVEEAINTTLNARERFTEYVLALVRFLEETNTISQRELASCREQLFKRASEPVRAAPRKR